MTLTAGNNDSVEVSDKCLMQSYIPTLYRCIHCTDIVLCYCISFHHFNVYVENFTPYVTLYLYVC